MAERKDPRISPDALAPSSERIGRILRDALDGNLIGDHAPLIQFFDLDAFASRIRSLRAAFPSTAEHTIAVKANPVAAILRIARAHGLGAECASPGELALARTAGFTPPTIIYDSPVKTERDIERLLDEGIRINIDNTAEFERILRYLRTTGIPAPSLGIRLNTGMRRGRYVQTSTATRGGKFGETARGISTFLRREQGAAHHLNRVHVHTGSQGYPVEMLVESITGAVAFARELNVRFDTPIDSIDIGGGLPVRYRPGDPLIGFEQYVRALRDGVPELFGFRIMTEFGRSLLAPPGWTACRIEYVKTGRTRIALGHAGADLFLRSAYMDWYHHITVFDPAGRPKTDDIRPHDIAGPLCFSGDYIARRRLLPCIDPGDWLVIHDTGAYTSGMWSLYNSRFMPPILGYREGSAFEILFRGWDETDILRLWDREEHADAGQQPDRGGRDE